MRFTFTSKLIALFGFILLYSCSSDGGGTDDDDDNGNNPSNPTSLIEWQKPLGGSNSDYGQAVTQTSDGGYIVAGYSKSNDGDVSGHHGSSFLDDFWIVKLSVSGQIQWQKSLGGSLSENAYSIKQTSDGGYIIVGNASSSDGDVVGGVAQGSDGWIVKLNSSGNIQWQKTYGYPFSTEILYSVEQTSDGGYVAAGYTEHGTNNASFWIIKCNSNGILEWEKLYGGSSDDRLNSINQTADGGYIVAGRTYSNDGDVSGNHGDFDWWVAKLSSSGALQWQKTLGGSGMDEAYSVKQTSDNGYIIAGWTGSSDGDITNYRGNGDYWVVKLNSSGGMVWQKALGGTNVDKAYSIQQTSDDNYIIAGYTSSNNGDVSGNHGSDDFWIVKLNGTGNLIWQKTFGGSGLDQARSIEQTPDNGFIIAGTTWSNDGDVIGNNDTFNPNFWVVKTTAINN